jgi:hypothetical protein
MTTTEEPIHQASQQVRQRKSVKHLPELLSRRNRNRVLKLSSSYRIPMVKHEPELHKPDCTHTAYTTGCECRCGLRVTVDKLPRTRSNTVGLARFELATP